MPDTPAPPPSPPPEPQPPSRPSTRPPTPADPALGGSGATGAALPDAEADARARGWLAPVRVDELFLFQLARLVASSRVPVVRRCESQFGITRREWGLLGQLAEADGGGPSALADRAGLDRARTSRVLSGLVAKGLVRRRPGLADRREAQLHLTERGRQTVQALWPQVAAINRALLSALAPEELAPLASMLARLKAQADRMVAEAAETDPAADPGCPDPPAAAGQGAGTSGTVVKGPSSR